jgi:hypothetical protein
MTDTPEHRAWCAIKTRCSNENLPYYEDYGGRGIRVCKRWRLSFPKFFADMGPRPSSKHSIERKDNDGNYEPGNCIWATPNQQARNKRDTKRLTFRGIIRAMADWSEVVGIPSQVIGDRLRLGWSVERALTQALCRRDAPRVFLTYRGELRSMKEWAAITGIRYGTIAMRLRLGWSIDRALGEPLNSRGVGVAA